MRLFLKELRRELPDLTVIEKEIGNNYEDIQSFNAAAERFGINNPAVPAVFLGDNAWIGFSKTTLSTLRSAVLDCLKNGCPDALNDEFDQENTYNSELLDTQIFGTISLDSLPLIVSTALLAFLDGINPCSLWVLTFLLAMIMHWKSRRRAFLVGVTFLLATSLVYGLFILGLVRTFTVLPLLPLVRIFAASAALLMGLINLKDFFLFERGISLSISKERKKKIGDHLRKLISGNTTLPVVLSATVLIAAGTSIIELPCTAGFPMIWANILAGHEINAGGYAALLLIYLSVYLLDEVTVLLVSVIGLRRITIDKTKGRFLKLLSGLVMTSLALILIIRPEVMESVLLLLAVFLGCLAISFLLLIIDKRLRQDRSQRNRRETEHNEQKT
jgi:hypothetical protein